MLCELINAFRSISYIVPALTSVNLHFTSYVIFWVQKVHWPPTSENDPRVALVFACLTTQRGIFKLPNAFTATAGNEHGVFLDTFYN